MGAVLALALLCLLATAQQVQATTYSDRGSGILVWPKIVANADNGVDTLIQIANIDQANPVAAHCFYVNANSHCSNTGAVCQAPGDECIEPGGFRGACVPDWIEIDFNVVLTQDQPLAWSALGGLRGSDLPCPSPGGPCKDGQSNAGTRVPPVPESPFIGELKCVQVDVNDRRPIGGNNLVGNATVEGVFLAGEGYVAAGKYNAVGIRALAPNADGELIIGGGGGVAEYEPCAEILVLNHLFDGAEDPISLSLTARTELTLVPCSEDFLTQRLSPLTAQFLVYNEFEQRFSTSRQVPCLLDSQLSLIDTTQAERSIFNAAVSGTVAGQTRIRGVNGGLIGAAVLNYDEGPLPPIGIAAYNLHQTADRTESDRIRIP